MCFTHIQSQSFSPELSSLGICRHAVSVFATFVPLLGGLVGARSRLSGRQVCSGGKMTFKAVLLTTHFNQEMLFKALL